VDKSNQYNSCIIAIITLMEDKRKLKKKDDGTVSRKGVCDCGNILYEKNLTNNSYQFLSLQYGKDIRNSIRTPKDGNNYSEITCGKCGLIHKVLGFFENVAIEEDIVIK